MNPFRTYNSTTESLPSLATIDAPMEPNVSSTDVVATSSSQPRAKRTNKPKKRCEHGIVKSGCKQCKGSAMCAHGKQRCLCISCGGSALCIHQKRKSRCVECCGSEICVHKKRKSVCVECGGQELCGPHAKPRSKCFECGGSSFCTHHKLRWLCVECGGASICTHGRIRSDCIDCEGVGICIHKKHRSKCVECEGGSICLHKRVRSECRECGGGSICEHQRKRSACVDCHGGQICPHNRVRSDCRDCGGSSFCIHGTKKTHCIPCAGSCICEHGKYRSNCKQCHGGAICEHNRQRSSCKECGGGGLCEHGTKRSHCVPCGGGAICVHKRMRSHCVECGGGGTCEHKKKRGSCSICSGCEHGTVKRACKSCIPLEKRLASRHFCKVCTDKHLGGKRLQIGICAGCDPLVPQRIELVVRPLLLARVVHPPSVVDDVTIGGKDKECNTEQKRRPDMAWYGTDRAVFVEIDEDGGHPDRTDVCELAKIGHQFEAVQKLLGVETRVFMLRFNPDRYDGPPMMLDERLDVLAAKINHLCTADLGNITPLVPHLGYYFYHSSCRKHIDAALARPDSVHVFRCNDVDESPPPPLVRRDEEDDSSDDEEDDVLHRESANEMEKGDTVPVEPIESPAMTRSSLPSNSSSSTHRQTAKRKRNDA